MKFTLAAIDRHRDESGIRYAHLYAAGHCWATKAQTYHKVNYRTLPVYHRHLQAQFEMREGALIPIGADKVNGLDALLHLADLTDTDIEQISLQQMGEMLTGCEVLLRNQGAMA